METYTPKKNELHLGENNYRKFDINYDANKKTIYIYMNTQEIKKEGDIVWRKFVPMDSGNYRFTIEELKRKNTNRLNVIQSKLYELADDIFEIDKAGDPSNVMDFVFEKI